MNIFVRYVNQNNAIPKRRSRARSQRTMNLLCNVETNCPMRLTAFGIVTALGKTIPFPQMICLSTLKTEDNDSQQSTQSHCTMRGYKIEPGILQLSIHPPIHQQLQSVYRSVLHIKHHVPQNSESPRLWRYRREHPNRPRAVSSQRSPGYRSLSLLQ